MCWRVLRLDGGGSAQLNPMDKKWRRAGFPEENKNPHSKRRDVLVSFCWDNKQPPNLRGLRHKTFIFLSTGRWFGYSSILRLGRERAERRRRKKRGGLLSSLWACALPFLPSQPELEQPRHLQGTCYKCRFSGPSPDLLNQKLWEWSPPICVSTSSWWLRCLIKFENHPHQRIKD